LIPGGVTADFSESCALRSTQPLKMSTTDFSWDKGGLCFWLTTYHPCSAETLRKSGALTYPEPLGPPRPVAGDLYLLPYILYAVSYFNQQSTIYTSVGTLIVATIYLQLIQNRYMFRSFTVLQCSHQHCLQPVASDVEVVGYL